jgi:hypothetical protein
LHYLPIPSRTYALIMTSGGVWGGEAAPRISLSALVGGRAAKQGGKRMVLEGLGSSSLPKRRDCGSPMNTFYNINRKS